MNFEFQIDAFTETGGAGEGISAPGSARSNPFLACHKGAAVPLLKDDRFLKFLSLLKLFGQLGKPH